MEFNELLDNYINRISCTIKELAQACELSPSVISRYKSGEREPNINGEQIEKLATGIHSLLSRLDIDCESREDILDTLKEALNKKRYDLKIFSDKFDLIIRSCNINVSDLSSKMNFDNSYIYRIRQGTRHPNDLPSFVDSFCEYLCDYLKAKDFHLLTDIIPSFDDMMASSDLKAVVSKWMLDSSGGVNEAPDSNSMSTFLDKVNDFNLGEYIKAIHFDELKVPTIPFYKPFSKNYYGVAQMRTGELDFFKATALSKSTEPIFMHSDMPMMEMSKDMDFNRKWMFGIAASLKKGLTLNIIHNLDRPFDELMLGLEAWIPIYMTGQVNPYYLPEASSKDYHHLTYVSGVCALRGECIDGDNNSGKYYLSSNKREVAYYRRFSNSLLKKAKPLMEIYAGDRISIFNKKYKEHLSEETESDKFHQTLNNIRVDILNNHTVIISKKKTPEIYFVIKHPTMVNALTEFTPLV